MKKVIFPLIAAIAVLVPARARGQRASCDPTKSRLCQGLVSVHEFETGSDTLRRDSYGGLDWREPAGVNVGSNTGKLGSAAVEFSGASTNYLVRPEFGSFGAYWTVAFWFLPTTNGAAYSAQTLLALDTPNNRLMHIYLSNNGSVLTPAFLLYKDNGSTVLLNPQVTVSLNTWHLLVFGATPHLVGGDQIFLSLDNSAKYTATIGGLVRSGIGNLELGGRSNPGAGTPQNLTSAAQNSSTPFGWGIINDSTAHGAVAAAGDNKSVYKNNYVGGESNILFSWLWSSIPSDAQINSVSVFTLWSRDASSPGNCRVNVKLGANATNGPTFTCPATGGTRNDAYARPGGGNWSRSDIDGMSVTFQGLGGALVDPNNVYVDHMYVTVNWSPGFSTSSFTGRIDQLVIAARPWAAKDIDLFWNNNNGRSFPFVTE